MSGYVVDASIAVKWLVAETFSEEAARLLDDELTLFAPELLFAEAANALWVICRRGAITKDDYAEAIGVLKGLRHRFPFRSPCANSLPLRRVWRESSIIQSMIASILH